MFNFFKVTLSNVLVNYGRVLMQLEALIDSHSNDVHANNERIKALQEENARLKAEAQEAQKLIDSIRASTSVKY